MLYKKIDKERQRARVEGDVIQKDRQREAESQGGRGEGSIGREMLYKKIDKERQRARVEGEKEL